MHSPTIKHRGAFVATLLAGTFSMSISQSSLSTAYPAFMKAFGLGADTVAWLTTGFMLVMTLMIPVSPWLLHNVPFQRLFQAIELIFAIGTGLCIWAPSFTVLMIGRLLEAIAVGIIFPSFQTVLLTITPHSERGRVMGTAVTTTARQLFGAAGVMFATVLLESMQNTLRSHAGGFAVTFAVFAGVGLIGFLLALTLPKEFVKKVA